MLVYQTDDGLYGIQRNNQLGLVEDIPRTIMVGGIASLNSSGMVWSVVRCGLTAGNSKQQTAILRCFCAVSHKNKYNRI